MVDLTTVAGTSYTLAPGDDYLIFTNVAAVTVTVPPDTNDRLDFENGSVVNLTQNGNGQVMVAAGANVTVNSLLGAMAISGQYGMVSLIKEGANLWKLVGTLA